MKRRAAVWRMGPRDWASESCPTGEYRPRGLPIDVRVPFLPGRVSLHSTWREAMDAALAAVGLAPDEKDTEKGQNR